MDDFSINDFMNEVNPTSKKAQLHRLSADIIALKQAGYSNLQVNDYLQKKGLSIAKETLRRFIAKEMQSVPTSRRVVSSVIQPSSVDNSANTNLKQSLIKGEETAKKYIGDD